MTDIKVFQTEWGGVEYWRSTCLNRKFPPHFHDYWLAGKLLKGKRLVRLPAGNFILSPNAVFLLNAGEIHSCESIGEDAQWECLHFPVGVVRKLIPVGLGNPFFGTPLLVDKVMAGRFDQIAALLQKNNGLAELPYAIWSFLAKLGERSRMGMKKPDCENILGQARFLDPATISLAELAKKAGVSKNGFIHKFSRKFGVSPHKFIISLRLIKARKLLNENNSPVQAAIESGFYDQAHFSRTFRGSLGFNPGQYLKAWLNPARYNG